MIRSSRILNNAVTSNKIDDATIATADLADSAITTAKLNDDAVTEPKIDNTAVRTIRLASGQKLQVEDEHGFPLFIVDNDTKKVKIRGAVERI